MRIMTYNIWGDYFGNLVSTREHNHLEIFKRYNPDILGVQEVTDTWYKSTAFDYLREHYNILVPDVCGLFNYTPLIIKKDRFTVHEFGTEQLKDSPCRSKRMTFAALTDNENRKELAVINTHFWWMSGKEHDEVRVNNAKQLSAKMKHLCEKYGCPVFSFGDFNCNISTDAFRVFDNENIQLLNDVASIPSEVCSHHGDPVINPDGSCKGKKTDLDKTCSIDHIVAYGDGYNAQKYFVVQDTEALDGSDHSPVFCDLELL